MRANKNSDFYEHRLFCSRNKIIVAPPTLSESSVGQEWLTQFLTADQPAAAAMLNAMLLLNEEQVSTAIRGALDKIAKGARHRNKRIALYAEREFEQSTYFLSERLPDRNGRLRWRATGRSGPPAVKPVRGRSRVGSEGLIAFLVSQQTDAWPKIFMNHPGPDRLRAKSAPAGEIIIVTDFIGSGRRVRSLLDKFWAVPTVRSWISRNLVKFRVVAAAATDAGLTKARSHRLRPEVISEWIAPVIDWRTSGSLYFSWHRLIDNYGPEAGRGSGRYGFEGGAALIAFNYRIPNNTPAIIHHSEGSWHALYDGPAPPELHALFGVRSMAKIVEDAATENGIQLPTFLTEAERTIFIVLNMLRGRWHRGSETALAARTGMAVPFVMDVLREALAKRLINNMGRLTDSGYAFLEAGGIHERHAPIIATVQKPYYPEALRIPR